MIKYNVYINNGFRNWKFRKNHRGKNQFYGISRNQRRGLQKPLQGKKERIYGRYIKKINGFLSPFIFFFNLSCQHCLVSVEIMLCEVAPVKVNWIFLNAVSEADSLPAVEFYKPQHYVRQLLGTVVIIDIVAVNHVNTHFFRVFKLVALSLDVRAETCQVWPLSSE